jgi:hypothetical protein
LASHFPGLSPVLVTLLALWSLAMILARRCGLSSVAGHLAALPCRLLGCGEAGHAEPWLRLTDLAVGSASPCWQAFRAWSEQGFKVLKSGAWPWQQTRMTQAERAERLWLALAVSVLWLVGIGTEVDGEQRQETLGKVREKQPGRAAQRRHRLFVLGLAELLAAIVIGRPLPRGKLAPEPWPDTWQDVPTLTEQEFGVALIYP